VVKVDLIGAKPSPEGEGWVRENQNKEIILIYIPLIPTFSLREKGHMLLNQQYWVNPTTQDAIFFLQPSSTD